MALYSEEIEIHLDTVCELLNKDWGAMVDFVNAHPDIIESANNFVFKLVNENKKQPQLIELLVCLLEHNNILFHKEASYKTYQKLAVDLFNILNIGPQINPILEARAYSNSVYADYIFKDEQSKTKFENKLLNAVSLFEGNPLLINEQFLGYINTSQFYLFQGKHKFAINYLEKAKNIISQVNLVNYQALFWYHYSWIYVETGNYEKAKSNIESFFTNIRASEVSPAIYLHALNIHASIELRLGNFEQAYILATQCYERALNFYESEDKDVIAENLVTISRYYLTIKQYDESEKAIKKAIEILEKVFAAPALDPSQAAAHVLLGNVYLETGRYSEAKDEYIFAERYYEGLYKENFFNMYEVSIVLANLAILGYKSNDEQLRERYMRKLLNNFSPENDNVNKVRAISKKSHLPGNSHYR